MLLPYQDKQPVVPTSAKVFPSAMLAGDITLGERVNIWFNASLRGDMAPITIGDDTNIQDNAVVHTNTNLPTHIGQNCTVGHGAIVHACTVEDNCLIGMGSILLDGCHIETGSLIGAGALIPTGKRVPAGSLVIGNPMKIVRTLTTEEQQAILDNKDAYLELMRAYQ